MALRILTIIFVFSWAHQAPAATGFAGEFLSLGAGARALALGQAYVALATDATASYWNPAALGDVNGRQLHLMHTERFAGMVTQDYLALARSSGRGSGYGLSLLRLGVDDIPFTELEDPGRPLGTTNRPLVTSTETSADYALYLAYGRRWRQRVALGASVKGIYRTVGPYSAYGLGLDLGLRIRFHRSLTAAIVVRDATSTPVVWDTDTTDRIRPSLLLGLCASSSLGGGQLTGLVASRVGGDARDAAAQAPLNLGLEYIYARLALRAGLDEGRPAFGVGLHPHPRLQLDLAYAQHDDLESTQQFSAAFRF